MITLKVPLPCLLACLFIPLHTASLSADDGDRPVARATPVEALELLPGFEAELVYSVPREEQGSWVSLTTDDKGRLISSHQSGKLYRITPAPIGADASETEVEEIDLEIGHAQGLLYAFDSLYVVVSGNIAEGSGLYRVRDTSGDDQYDSVELLRRLHGGGEHGPHDVILSPDGESLFVVAGNFTNIPDPEHSRVPRNWDEDHLLPRMWDARGHASGLLAPGGWIAETNPDGDEWTLHSSGYRNAYGIAFNREGELFTFDSDMEWDIGTPWYRPIRVNHAVSGSEFGWRSGTGKWPEYYPDSLPAVADIGVGSPTGVRFGYGADFPGKYQNALYVADWSFGKLYAVHLEDDGATYTGEIEQFVAAMPLPFTAHLIHPEDGTMYFTIGGRNAQSGLYRIRYTGDESTEPSEPKVEPVAAAVRELRRALESYHGVEDPAALDAAWSHLGSHDRFVRYAARVAVEHQPVDQWAERALRERNPQASLTALLALARNGDESLQPQLIDALERLDYPALPEQQKLEMLRVYQLAFTRMGKPSDGIREQVIAKLDSHYPAPTSRQNFELSQLMVYLEAPAAAGRTLELMTEAPSQEQQIHYALVLRNLESGWTMDQRRTYFSWFNHATDYRGGASFTGFVNNIKDEAVEKLSEEEKEALADILEAEEGAPVIGLNREPRSFVKNWTVDEAVEVVEGNLTGRDFEQGRRMFGAAQCFACHRVDGQGGVSGPDLTAVAGRFSIRDIISKTIDPNQNVSDQYRNTIFTMEDGSQVIGRVANLSNDNLSIVTSPLAPGSFTNINRNNVVSREDSPISPMMPGLFNTLDEEELKDVMAYLISGGDPDHSAFE